MTNKLFDNFPELHKEWCYTRNKINPELLTYGSNKKAFWVCALGHVEYSSIKEKVRKFKRNKKSTCGYCNNRKLLIGYNDMWTTAPEIAKLLLDSNDGYKYFATGSQRVDWRCPKCSHIIKNRRIRDINVYGLSCRLCSDKRYSFGERFIRYFLLKNKIDFISEKVFSFAKQYRYDFFLPQHNKVIEVHGAQHYEEANGAWNGVTLKEQQEIDAHKKSLLIQNNIEYIEFNAMKSDIVYLLSMLEKNKQLKNLFNYKCEIDTPQRIMKHVQTSENQKILECYTTKTKELQEISKILNIPDYQVRKVLKNYSNAGLCDFNEYSRAKTRRAVFQYNSETGELLQEWESVRQAMRYCVETYGSAQPLRNALYKPQYKNLAYGFYWE